MLCYPAFKFLSYLSFYAHLHLQLFPLHRSAITGFACEGLCGLERQNKELSKFNRHIKAI